MMSVLGCVYVLLSSFCNNKYVAKLFTPAIHFRVPLNIYSSSSIDSVLSTEALAVFIRGYSLALLIWLRFYIGLLLL